MLHQIFASAFLLLASLDRSFGFSDHTLSAATRCRSVALSVRAAADNAVFRYPPDAGNATQLIDFVKECFSNSTGPLLNSTVKVTDNFKVHGTYCRPRNRGRGTIQLLVHGASYDRRVWSGYGFGDNYNWQKKAAARGYHTLAIDRLGHGRDKQRLDPINVVQGVLEVEILHQIILALRKNFSRVVLVGHSYGSILGTALVGKYPNDVDAFVATGYSSSANFTVLDLLELAPAAHVSPRFSRLPLGYLAGKSMSGRAEAYYGGFVNERIPEYDFWHQDTVTVGENCQSGLVGPAIGFTKPVLAVVGEYDKLFCNGELSSCDDKLKLTGETLFPNASYQSYVALKAGHNFMLQYSAPKTFEVVHGFLNGLRLGTDTSL